MIEFIKRKNVQNKQPTVTTERVTLLDFFFEDILYLKYPIRFIFDMFKFLAITAISSRLNG